MGLHWSLRVVLFLIYTQNITVFAAENVTVDDSNNSSITYLPPNAWSLYSGNRLNYNTTHHLTQTENATASFNFTGIAIYYLSPLWPYNVNTVVQLDSEKGTVVDLQDYNSQNTGGQVETVQSQVLWNRTGLANTQHNLLISVGNSGYGVVDALVYTTETNVTSSSSSLSPTSTSQDPNVASSTVVTPSPNSKSKSVVVIALGSLFGTLGLFVVVGGLWYFFRRRKRRIPGAWTIDLDDAPHATTMLRVISASTVGPNATNNMGNRTAEPLDNGSSTPQPGLSWNNLVPSCTTTGRMFDHYEMGHTVLRTTESSMPEMAEGMPLLATAPPSYDSSEADYYTAAEGSEANHDVSQIQQQQQQQQKPGKLFQYNH